MKKMLFRNLSVISFIIITFFSIVINANAENNFAYKDFNWDEYAKANNTFWSSKCSYTDDENCVDKILATKKRFYIRLYELLAQAEEKGYFIDDDLIIATVYVGLTPESFKDPEEGEYNPYNLDDSEDSSTKNSFIFDFGSANTDETQIQETKRYFENEVDSLKTLVNAFVGYESQCYVESSEQPTTVTKEDGSTEPKCPTQMNQYIDNKCLTHLNTFKGTFWDVLGLSISNSDAKKKCDEEAQKVGYTEGILKTSKEEKVSDSFYWDYLENNNYFDKKDHLQRYFTNVLSAVGKSKMSELTSEEYEEQKDNIIYARRRIIKRIKEVLDYDETVSHSFQQVASTSNNGYWWPIGSDAIESLNEVKMATGDPAKTSISSKYGMRTDPISGEANKMHYGIDIPGDLNTTNVIASKSGVIVDVYNGCEDGASKDCNSGYGNFVIIQHVDNNYTLYAHLALNSITVNVNDSVNQGQVIGKVGNSGNSTGSHLHFEVRVGGNNSASAQNPLNYVSSENSRSTSVELDGVLKWIANMEGQVTSSTGKYVVYQTKGDIPTVGHGITIKYHTEQFKARGIDPDTLVVGAEVPADIVDDIYYEDVNLRMDYVKKTAANNNLSLNDNQIAAVTSLYFNAGPSAVSSFVERYKEYGSTDALCENWWNNAYLHSDPSIKKGLINRRKKECKMFVYGTSE